MRNYAREMYGNSLSDWGEGFVNFWHNLFNSWSGKDMTEAQLNQIDVNREDATTAYNRQLYMDSTKYQREVADMKAAGINPMLAASGGVSSPSVQLSNSASSQQGTMNLGSLLQAAMMPAQLSQINAQTKVARAQADNIKADTANKEADTAGKLWLNDFNKRTEDLRAEGMKKANELTDSQKDSYNASVKKYEQDIKESIERSKTEQEKRDLMLTQEILNTATADNIVYMQPIMEDLYTAQTDKERSVAAVNAVDAAYRQGLIDSGSIAAAVRLTNAQASEAEVSKEVKEIEKWLEGYERASKEGTLSSYLKPDPNSGSYLGKAWDQTFDLLTRDIRKVSNAVLGR